MLRSRHAHFILHKRERIIMSKNNTRQVEVYLFPRYVTTASIQADAKPIYDFFQKQSIELTPRYWDGSIEGLPKNPSLVRASSQMYCTREEFYNACKSKGHVGFYECQSLTEEQEDLLQKLINEEELEGQNEFIGKGELDVGFSMFRDPNTPIPLLKEVVSSAERSAKPVLDLLAKLDEHLSTPEHDLDKVPDNETK